MMSGCMAGLTHTVPSKDELVDEGSPTLLIVIKLMRYASRHACF